ncbi:hypothetical protein [Pseudomonas sp. WS 5027]|uniref:hypothetical protein n=1 Tax=Pseudomonas sp. WS 5027 TaxID=2717483 RepID=UPI001475E359|nr:hypothetical protein [Pseudomonas sp. WS 5027]NMY47191.1 hypothetical protein [Pseudomonas sp. WS 5027]
MELLDQFEQSGLRVVDGKRRLQAALEDGRTVTASGGDGKVYSISMQQGTVNVLSFLVLRLSIPGSVLTPYSFPLPPLLPALPTCGRAIQRRRKSSHC